jgi:hypothetical protein
LPVFSAEQIASSPASQDQRRLEALVDLLAQVANVDVDHVGTSAVVVVEELLVDHGAADDLPLAASGELQQVKLEGRQGNQPASSCDGAVRGRGVVRA